MSTKPPHQKIRWNLGILRSERNSIHDCLGGNYKTKIKSSVSTSYWMLVTWYQVNHILCSQTYRFEQQLIGLSKEQLYVTIPCFFFPCGSCFDTSILSFTKLITYNQLKFIPQIHSKYKNIFPCKSFAFRFLRLSVFHCQVPVQRRLQEKSL